MMRLANGFKAALAEGRRQIGLWQALANPYAAEICAGAGFDWLLFDGEHAPNDVPLLLAQLQAVAPYSVHPVARLAAGDPVLIKQYLDIGFQTLLVPFVESVHQARALVRATRYPPAGIRGIGAGLARAARWNRIPDYLDRADAEICLIAQVESEAGLRNLGAIAAVEGIDAIFIGTADLSAALGYRGQPGHAAMIETIAAALAAMRAAGKPAGILATSEADFARAVEAGCSFIAVGTDVALLARSAEALARVRGGQEPAADRPGGY